MSLSKGDLLVEVLTILLYNATQRGRPWTLLSDREREEKRRVVTEAYSVEELYHEVDRVSGGW